MPQPNCTRKCARIRVSARLRLELGVLVEHRQDRLAPCRRQREDQSIESEVEKFFELLLVRADSEHRDWKLFPPGFLTSLRERLQPGAEIVSWKIDRHPSVAVLGDPLVCFWRLRAEQNRRSTLLHRFGERPHRLEVHKLAMKLRGLLWPNLAHREHFFPDDFPAALEDLAANL